MAIPEPDARENVATYAVRLIDYEPLADAPDRRALEVLTARPQQVLSAIHCATHDVTLLIVSRRHRVRQQYSCLRQLLTQSLEDLDNTAREVARRNDNPPQEA